MPTVNGRFVVVAGPPCSGKSTLAARLSQLLSAPHLSMDEFRQRMLPQSDQRVEHRDIAYRAMHLAAELMAPWCPVVVVDATYTARTCRADLLQVVERVSGHLFVVECHVDPATAEQRLATRHMHPAVDLTPARVVALAQDYPYSDAVVAVSDDGARTRLIHSLTRSVTEPLSAAGRVEWCLRGQLREA